MGDTDNIISAAYARESIIDFFNKKKNKENLFNEIIETLKLKDDFFYIYQNKEKLEIFHDCIVNGHFKWICDVTNNQIQTEFNSKYTNECEASRKIYIDFYKIFNNKISNSNQFSKRAERLLLKYSKFLAE